MTTHPTGATLHLGGDAWAMPSLEPLLVPIDTLVLYPGNPRRGDQEAITSSIRDHGLYAGVVTQTTTRHTLVGNHRLRSLLDLGATMAPSTPADVDDTRAAQIVARDNLTSDRGGYDDTEQLALLEALAAQDQLPGSGYSADDLDALRRVAERSEQTPRNDPDDAPPLPVTPPISKDGDVWRLGPHRLVVGDSTLGAAYDALLQGEDVDMIWTDPPYNADYSSRVDKQRRKPWGGIRNDSMTVEAFDAFLTDFHMAMWPYLRDGGAAYVWTDWKRYPQVARVYGEAFNQKAMILWDKTHFGLGTYYRTQHELCLFGVRGDRVAQWHAGHDERDVWTVRRDSVHSYQHPTQKPVEVAARAIRNSSSPGDIVLDPFGGSGTSLIACQQEDRTARLIELDPRYADVICRRYQQHTGTLPVRDGVQVDFTEVLAPVQDDGEVLAPTNRAE